MFGFWTFWLSVRFWLLFCFAAEHVSMMALNFGGLELVAAAGD